LDARRGNLPRFSLGQKNKIQDGSRSMTLHTRIRTLLGVFAIAFAIAFVTPAAAQAPTSVNPTASSVNEEKLLRELDKISGRCTLPNQQACTIETPANQSWREFHQVTLRWIAAISIIGVFLALVIFYLTRGMVKIESGRSGRTITRFNAFERFVHWMTATCFIILALSGLNITFGKSLLLPLMGPEAFTAISQWGKYFHNYLSFPFTIGVVLIFLMWIGGNIPNRTDVEWVKRGGGIVGNDHPPAYRFNGGQKMIYWIVVLGGVAVAITGYILMFPFYGTTTSGVQLAQIIHGIVAALFIAAMLGHIYIGSIGMEGAFEAMGSGEVDVNWAKEHHRLWLEEEMGKGDTRAKAQPAE
jgi:formate dehydrogenase subunit gamma